MALNLVMSATFGLYFFIVWLVGSIIVGSVASAKGRSSFGWFCLSFLLMSPVFCLLALIAFPTRVVTLQHRIEPR